MTVSAPFLTQLDPRRAIEGSRDPLGMQPIWSTLGRLLVGNVTTVATSVRGFTTLLLGLRFAGRLVDDAGGNEEDRLRYFLKFEQLAAYSRFGWQAKTGDRVAGIRGIRKVNTRWATSGGRPWIAMDRDGEILGDQKTYGLWGLYSVPAKDSGLREKATARLTPAASEHIEGRLGAALQTNGLRDGARVEHLLQNDQNFEPKGKHSAVGTCIAELHAPTFGTDELAFYRQALVYGGKEADQVQGRLWGYISAANEVGSWDADFGLPELRLAREQARAAHDGDVVERLTWIADVEAVLAPMSLAFTYLLASHGQTLDSAADGLRSAWGDGLDYVDLDGLRAALPLLGSVTAEGTARRLEHVATALGKGDWSALVTLLLEQNQAVMEARGAGPWASIRADRLDVQFRGERNTLPPAAKLRDHMVNPYYLGALKTVGRTLFRPDLGDRSAEDE